MPGNIFVDPHTMPGWLQPIVAVDPVVRLADTSRGLGSGDAPGPAPPGPVPPRPQHRPTMRLTPLLLLALPALLCAQPARQPRSPPPASAFSAARLQRLDAYLQQQVDSLRVAGAAGLVLRADSARGASGHLTQRSC